MIKAICIAAFVLFVTGCETVKDSPPIAILDNKEKDAYISKVEGIVSDAGAGIVAVLDSLDKGSIQYAVLEAQAVRLGGIKAPSVTKLTEQKATIAEKDSKAAANDKVEALKVDYETSLLWERVELLDGELAIEKAAKELAIEEKARAVKDKILWLTSVIGIAIFTAGVVVVAFTSKKLSGFILMICGIVSTSLAWIVDAHWFQYVAGFGVGFIVIDILFIMVKKTIDFLRAKKTGQTEITEQSVQ